MSVKVTALIWKMPLLLPEKLVLLRMADFADHDGGSIFPSVATLAQDCGISDRAVQLVLRKFVADGLLIIVGNETGGRGRTRHYAIDLERAAEMAGPGGEPKRAKRVKRDFTHSNGHDHSAERAKRVQDNAVKGEEILHPTCHRPVIEETSGAVCVTSASPPARAHTHEAPPRSAEIIPIRPAVWVMPDNWPLPDDWREWALSVGHWDPDGAAEKFKTTWLARRDRGEPGAANSDAVWRRYFEGWINGDLKQGPRHGQHRGGTAGRGSYISRAALGLPT